MIIEKNRKVLKVLFVFYSFFIFVLSVIPRGIEVGSSDKLSHFLAFFVFAVLLKVSYRIPFMKTIVFSLLFGSFIEFVQFFLPYRSCDPLDLVADGAGSVLGSLVISVLLLRSKK
ncbi:MAG: VanZ family protein [Desulfurobacteriaceae bacterium]